MKKLSIEGNWKTFGEELPVVGQNQAWIDIYVKAKHWQDLDKFVIFPNGDIAMDYNLPVLGNITGTFFHPEAIWLSVEDSRLKFE